MHSCAHIRFLKECDERIVCMFAISTVIDTVYWCAVCFKVPNSLLHTVGEAFLPDRRILILDRAVLHRISPFFLFV